MSLLDELGTALASVGHGIATVARGAWDTSPIGVALQNAKYQQYQLQRQQHLDQQTAAQRDFENQLQLQGKGAVPAEIEQPDPDAAPLPGGKTLIRRTPNPAAQGAGQTVVDPESGKRFYIPTASEKQQADLNDSNSFTLSDDLAAEAQKAGLTNIRAGVRYPKADMASLNERLAAYHRANDPEEEEPLSGNFTEASGKAVPLQRGKKTGTVSVMALPPGVSAADKPDVSQRVPDWVGPNGGFLVFDKNTQTTKEVPVVPGSKQVMTPAQEALAEAREERIAATRENRANRAEDNAQAGRDRAQKRIDLLDTQEQQQHQRRAAYGRVLSQPNSKSKEANGQLVTVIDPDNGREVEMTPARRAYYQDRYDKADQLAGSYSQQKVKLIRRNGGETGAAYVPQKQQGAAATAPAAGQGASQRPITEGTSIANPKTGERMILKGGKWVTLPKVQ